MRRYPANSPQAAARIVALTVVADGDISDAEVEWLDRLAVNEQLGLARHELHALLDTFCKDLLAADQLKWADACPVDERTLAELTDEIQDPALCLKLLGPRERRRAHCDRRSLRSDPSLAGSTWPAAHDLPTARTTRPVPLLRPSRRKAALLTQ